MSTQYYSRLAGVACSFFGISGLVSIFIMYKTQDWNNILMLHIFLDAFVVTMYFKFVVETPLYNLAMKKFGYFITDIVYMAKLNGVYESIVKEKVEYFNSYCKLSGTRRNTIINKVNDNQNVLDKLEVEDKRRGTMYVGKISNRLKEELPNEKFNEENIKNNLFQGKKEDDNIIENQLDRFYSKPNDNLEKNYNEIKSPVRKTNIKKKSIEESQKDLNNTNKEYKEENSLNPNPENKFEDNKNKGIVKKSVSFKNEQEEDIISKLSLCFKKYFFLILKDFKNYFLSMYSRYSQIFQKAESRRTFFLFLFPYLSIMIDYYGQLIFIDKIPGNILLNSFILYLSDFISPNIAGYIMSFSKRKQTLTIFHSGIIIVGLILPMVPEGVFYSILLFFNCFLINSIEVGTDIFAAESFDASIKSSAMLLLILCGFSAVVFGDTLMDFVGTPFYLFAILSVCSIVAIYYLKEPEVYLEGGH